MLTPELSRLKGAPSTCVCSVGHRNEKAIMGDVFRARDEIKPDIFLKARRFQSRPASHVHARPNSKSRQSQKSLRGNRKSETFVLVAHDRGEPRQQATVEQEKTMLTPELSRLKGAPSTCVCSVGHRNEKAIMGDVIRARHEIRA